ncbi:leucine-rich repeat domain-containing protein [Phocaeicola vulgatus]|uniref:leucine-rich repeat protein n=1 Tax=Phocaeicola vulgatus TaxID=821 RepID=UPI00374E128D|nr:leucine-rich repeat domain-containing protein [Phocaeicola vulgatus]
MIGCKYEHCTKLTKVTIPNSVVSLGWFAFHECSSLTRIVIPNHVATISEFAFTIALFSPMSH